MRPQVCNRFDSCSAPICPLDKSSLENSVWYPDEEVCLLKDFSKLNWIRNQRKIARKVRNKDFYFTLEMLSRNCVITVATEGIDPDSNDFDDSRTVLHWLAMHPEKKEISKEDHEKLLTRLKKANEMKEAIRPGYMANKKKPISAEI